MGTRGFSQFPSFPQSLWKTMVARELVWKNPGKDGRKRIFFHEMEINTQKWIVLSHRPGKTGILAHSAFLFEIFWELCYNKQNNARRLHRRQVTCGSVPRRKVWCSRLWTSEGHFFAEPAAPVASRVWQRSEEESLVLAALARQKALSCWAGCAGGMSRVAMFREGKFGARGLGSARATIFKVLRGALILFQGSAPFQ